MRRRVVLGLTMFLVAAAVVAPERAGAAVGDLGFVGCLADDPAGSGCDDLGPAGPEGSLSGVGSLAVSPDGASVYTTGNADGDIGILTRFAAGLGGDLTPAGCVADAATAGGCADLPPAGPQGPLTAARDVAVGADSTTVHTASGLDQVATFGLDLTYRGCVARETTWAGCRSDVPSFNMLPGLTALVAPPGGSVLATARAAVVGLRMQPDGNLAYSTCVGFGACKFSETLRGARDIALAPSGNSLAWAVSEVEDTPGRPSDAVTALRLDASGEPSAFSPSNVCAADNNPRCDSRPPFGALLGAQRLAVSPDAFSIYVLGDRTVTHLRQGGDGVPWFEGCLTSRPDTGVCNEMAAPGMVGATDLAVSPDGRSLYVVVGTRLLAFDRSGDGVLSYAGCVADGSESECADIPPAGAYGPFGGTMSVAVSPDGASVYVTSDVTSAITHFSRSVDGSPPRGDLGMRNPRRGTTTQPPPVVSTRRPTCQGKRATIVAKRGRRTLGTNRRDVIVGTSRRDVIDARRGDDLVCAAGGDDSVIGGAGADRLYGQNGNDRLSGGSGRDRLSGGAGRDRLSGGGDRDRLIGGAGRDRLDGGPGRDRGTQ